MNCSAMEKRSESLRNSVAVGRDATLLVEFSISYQMLLRDVSLDLAGYRLSSVTEPARTNQLRSIPTGLSFPTVRSFRYLLL
jgi:hypothetical protein